MIVHAQKVIDACVAIAKFSESPDNITRTFLSPPTRQVHQVLKDWMQRLGMETKVDAAGNLRGVYRGCDRDLPRLLIGSHIDTVPNAGAFDGVLGVVMALVLMEALEGKRLSYDIEVIAFSEEEGVRYKVPFIGSRAIVGEIDDSLLKQKDERGIALKDAIEDFGLRVSQLSEAILDQKTFAYLEFHIEQGPVLDSLNIGLGIVEAIAGQSRYQLIFRGRANHAGTTPMRLRHDALSAAAEWITAVEQQAMSTDGLVATVGRCDVLPNATNVIAAQVQLGLDIRHAVDATRHAAATRLIELATEIATRRGLTLEWTKQFEESSVAMDTALAFSLEKAAIATGSHPQRMVSGAGHDAMIVAKRVPSAMLFLRSPGGISHHPDESVLLEDIEAALAAGLYFLQQLEPQKEALRTPAE